MLFWTRPKRTNIFSKRRKYTRIFGTRRICFQSAVYILDASSKYAIILYWIVLCCIALCWWPIRPLLYMYRHSLGVVRNLHSTVAEWGIFNLQSMSPQVTHLLTARRRNSINIVLVTISGMACLIATCEPRTINLSITGERITFTM